MRRTLLAMACMISLAALPFSFEDNICAMIDGLEDSVERLSEYSGEAQRGLMNALQSMIDEAFEDMGVAQNHAGYYLEQINAMDTAGIDFARMKNMMVSAKVLLTATETSVVEYKNWYDSLLSKVSEIRRLQEQYLDNNDLANWQWLKAYFHVGCFTIVQDSVKVDSMFGFKDNLLKGKLVHFNEPPIPSDNIIYGEKVCNTSGNLCYCRYEHKFEGLEEAKALADNFERLALGWEKYNNENDIPD